MGKRDALPWSPGPFPRGVYKGCCVGSCRVSGPPVTDLCFTGHSCGGEAEAQVAVGVTTTSSLATGVVTGVGKEGKRE